MTSIIIEDPCLEKDIPERPDPTAPEITPPAQSLLQLPDTLFPSRQADPIEQSTIRESAIIEKYLWTENLQSFNQLRYPIQAQRLIPWQDRQEFLDTFRFVAGKNWRFENQDLNFYNTDLNASLEKSMPFSLNVISYMQVSAQTNRMEEECEIVLTPNLSIFTQLANQSRRFNQEISQTTTNVANTDYYHFHKFIFGKGEYQTPLIPDTTNWKYDFCFSSAAGFFQSEVDQAIVPLKEGVSIVTNYSGIPEEPVDLSVPETSKQSLYRYESNLLDPSVPFIVSGDTEQIFHNLEGVYDTTQDASADLDQRPPRFSSNHAKKILNNHVRITFDTGKVEQDNQDSVITLLSASGLRIPFLNFLVKSNIKIDSEKRFVQLIDQSSLGGIQNNNLVLDHEPKTYEQKDESGNSSDNFREHYDFESVAFEQTLSDETYNKSPYPYNRDNYLTNLDVLNPYIGDFFHRIGQLKNKKGRTFEDILIGKKAHSEVVAYRVEKSNSEGEVLQNFYFLRSNSFGVVDFIDTQVFYDRIYNYKIYAINFVIGNKYKYTVPEFMQEFESDTTYFQDEIQPFFFDVANQCIASIIETPYFEQQVAMIDKPPIFPQVSVVPFFQNAEKIGFRVTPTYGTATEKPIEILPEDKQIISKMKQNVAGEIIDYSSDTQPKGYEAILIDTPPESYSDFSKGQKFSVLASYNSGYIEMNLQPNKRYYIIFRAFDMSGISNPSVVYTFVLNSHADGVFIEFDEYDMISKDIEEPLTFERVIKIDPAPEQASVDFSNYMQQQGFYSSAPDVSTLSLGIQENKIWTKDYKIRIISRTTGKAIDLNVNYDYEIIKPQIDPDDIVILGDDTDSPGGLDISMPGQISQGITLGEGEVFFQPFDSDSDFDFDSVNRFFTDSNDDNVETDEFGNSVVQVEDYSFDLESEVNSEEEESESSSNNRSSALTSNNPLNFIRDRLQRARQRTGDDGY